jgi:hypothetical protein
MAPGDAGAYPSPMSITTEQERLSQRLGAFHDRIRHIADPEARAAFVEGWAARGRPTPETEDLIEEGEQVLDRLFGTMGYKVVGHFAGDEIRTATAETPDDACSLGDEMRDEGASSVVIVDPDRQQWSVENMRKAREGDCV